MEASYSLCPDIKSFVVGGYSDLQWRQVQYPYECNTMRGQIDSQRYLLAIQLVIEVVHIILIPRDRFSRVHFSECIPRHTRPRDIVGLGDTK